jgi:hypothetical protein
MPATSMPCSRVRRHDRRESFMSRTVAFGLTALIVTLLGSCGGNDTSSTSSSEPPAAAPPETTAAPQVGTTESSPSGPSTPSSEPGAPSSAPDPSIAPPTTGTIQGLAFLCRAPDDCAASTSVAIQPADGSSPRTLVTTDSSGRFTYSVSPGDWLVIGRFTLGMLCDREPVTVTVVAGTTVDAGTFNCTPP